MLDYAKDSVLIVIVAYPTRAHGACPLTVLG